MRSSTRLTSIMGIVHRATNGLAARCAIRWGNALSGWIEDPYEIIALSHIYHFSYRLSYISLLLLDGRPGGVAHPLISIAFVLPAFVRTTSATSGRATISMGLCRYSKFYTSTYSMSVPAQWKWRLFIFENIIVITIANATDNTNSTFSWLRERLVAPPSCCS